MCNGNKVIAHLGFVQSVISRMGTNSFLIKGWCATIVSAIFVLSAKDSNINFVWIAFFPAMLFWILDSYYLWQEKLFRKLYEEIALGNISSEHFTLNTKAIKKAVCSLPRVVFSKTIFPYYLSMLLIIVSVILVIS